MNDRLTLDPLVYGIPDLAKAIDLEIQSGPVPGLRARLDGPSGSIDLTGPAR